MKLLRTYIGGSKKNEDNIFDNLCDENDNVDWINYKKYFMLFAEDYEIVIKSRIKLSSILLFIFLLLILISNSIFQILSIILFAIILYYNIKLNKKYKRIKMLNEMTIGLINSNLYKLYNL